MALRTLVSAAAAGCAWLSVVVTIVAGQGQPAPPAGEFKPVPPPVQPVAYSHKLHIEQGLDCAECHESATTSAQASLPPPATCIGCHQNAATGSSELRKLAAFAASGDAVPWSRVYRVPDYVYFAHDVHLASPSGITCETCHGDVRGMEVMQKVKDTSMAACMECHRATRAPNRCDSCHDPI